MKKIYLIFIFILSIITINASALENCKWEYQNGFPCIKINKTSNTSKISSKGINKQIITKQDIERNGAKDIKSVLDMVSGLDLKQSGQRGQLTSLFMRGTNSNHTLVLLNGIAINDQSTTQGLHNFGQDFVQTIQQIEVYKGASGAHFGPSAIGGAINLITDIDYQNNFSFSGFIGDDITHAQDNNSINGNYSKITNNNWHINVKASQTKSKLGSARYGGVEDDGAENKQINLNLKKWLNDSLRFKSTIYSRQTKADYDGSVSLENGYTADDKMYAFQSGLNYKKDNELKSLIFHYNKYDREYDENGTLDNYYSNSVIVKGESEITHTNKFSYGYGSEYKYDWGNFKNYGSFYPLSQADGYVHNLGIFGNIGYQYDKNTILSGFIRSDDHKTTDINSTYKLSLNKTYDKINIHISQSTGLRNPTLYELYGSNGRSDVFKHVPNPNAKPEKSLTNEITLTYNFLDNIFFTTTAYKSHISDALLYDSNFNGGSGYTNTQKDLKQEGIETNIVFKGKNQKLSLFNTISSSKQEDGTHQLNRPDLTYGAKYFKKITLGLFGEINLNYDYKHFGKAFDYDPGIKKVDSSDIMNLSISKKLNKSHLTFQISNLLDEKYQRPIGYLQDGRQIRLNFKSNF